MNLSGRQQREQDFYDEFAVCNHVSEITFDPVLGKEKRPWNPYWFVYDYARSELKNGRLKLLDFGCGRGVAATRFAKVGYDVFAFDISLNCIRNAKLLARKYNVDKKISFSYQTAEKLDYESDYFDIIVGFDILHHVDVYKAIKEVYRILKKDGIAIFKEHCWVPEFDEARNSVIVKKIFSKEKSIPNHITQDERKLTAKEINAIKKIFPNTYVKKFTFLSRFDYFIRKSNSFRPSFLEKTDFVLFRLMPFIQNFAGTAVIIVQK